MILGLEHFHFQCLRSGQGCRGFSAGKGRTSPPSPLPSRSENALGAWRLSWIWPLLLMAAGGLSLQAQDVIEVRTELPALPPVLFGQLQSGQSDQAPHTIRGTVV